ncbi:hypothetical protein ABW21_db0208689 [Orbilia brochopaga]|nr:hypothetical protein ABW21_db0208689 [Drechslerella brochopaga]
MTSRNTSGYSTRYNSRRRSCKQCRNRRTRCELQNEPDGSTKCLWCIQHGKDCDLPDDEWSQQNVLRLPNDGFMIMNGHKSAHVGPKWSPLSFCLTEGSKETFLRVRKELTEKHKQWTDIENTDKLNLDPLIAKLLEDLFFARVQPYIPIITRAYLKSIRPSQLLLAALYGVAARLDGVLISTRDFVHIKNVLHSELLRLVNNYKPSLQACIALACIHLTLELQTNGFSDVEAWPLRLGTLVRMALELKLHKKSAQKMFSKDEQEMRRRVLWAIFIKDRWTSTSKGYPLMLSIQDIDIDLPSIRNLDPGHQKTQHLFFAELLQQSLVLGRCHPVAYRADRFKHVTVEAFREVEAAINELQHRLSSFQKACKDRQSQKTLSLTYTALKLLFYGPFFQPHNDAEARQFALFLPDITKLRVSLAREALSTIQYASKELVHSDPAIWSVGYHAQFRCYLVALNIKHDTATDYPDELRTEAETACDLIVDVAKNMCEERWSFRQMSGTLVLFCDQVAQDRNEVLSPRPAPETSPDMSISPKTPMQSGALQIEKYLSTPRRAPRGRKRKLSYDNTQVQLENPSSLLSEIQQIDYSQFPSISADNMTTPLDTWIDPVAFPSGTLDVPNDTIPNEDMSRTVIDQDGQGWDWALNTELEQGPDYISWDAHKHLFDPYGAPSFL